MELILALIGVFFALAYLVEKATNFVKQLKTSQPTKLRRGFQATLSIVPIDKKSEDCAANTSPPKR